MGRTDAIKSSSDASTKTNPINLHAICVDIIRFASWVMSQVRPNLILGGFHTVRRPPMSAQVHRGARLLLEKSIKIGLGPCPLVTFQRRDSGFVADSRGTAMPIVRLRVTIT